MWLTWPANTRLQSFYDPESHRLSIVSDVLDDAAEGRVYAHRLVVAASTAGVLRDLEVAPGPATIAPLEPAEFTLLHEGTALTVWIPDTQEVAVEECPGTPVVTVRLLPMSPERWFQLGDSSIAIGLVEMDVLAVVRVVPEVDLDGCREAQWLDSLDADVGASE